MANPLRTVLLRVSSSKRAYDLLMKLAVTRQMAARYVAGGTAEKAIKVARDLESRGFRTSLNLLGESVGSKEQALRATAGYIKLLQDIEKSGIHSTVSVKPTNLGLNFSTPFCLDNLLRIAEKAKETGNFVRFEMEGSQHCQATLDVFYKAHEKYDNIGIVIQAYLYRSEDDIRELIARKASVRLVKGAYLEPSTVAYQGMAATRRNYKKLAEMLLLSGGRHSYATHDAQLINYVKCFSAKHEINTENMEFQLLYGIRRDLQENLRGEGYSTLVYIPFGTHWFPYLVRRLAERPENMMVLLNSMLKETWDNGIGGGNWSFGSNKR